MSQLDHKYTGTYVPTDFDSSDLDAAPDAVKWAAANGQARVYLVTTYPDGSQWHRTGRIGRTTGTRPGYLLMSNASAIGSSDLLTASTWENTVVAGIQQSTGAGYYTPGNRPGSHAGVEYRTEPNRWGGYDYRVMPGRNRFTDPVPQGRFVPELEEYAAELRAAEFTIYRRPLQPTDGPRARVESTFFHYSREVDGRTCYGTVQVGQFGGLSHSMPIHPSRLNGSGAVVPTDHVHPDSVEAATIVASPSNWCPHVANPTPEALAAANRPTGAPKRFYGGATLRNATPHGIGTMYVPEETP